MIFHVRDKVYVKSTYSILSLAGAEGTVHVIDAERGIGVSILGYMNPTTASGLFWFGGSELTKAEKYSKTVNPFSIKNVYFNNPVIVVMWEDGTKTIVRCGENDQYDPEKGLAMAISKKALGNKGNYYNEFKKWIPTIKSPCETCEHRNKSILEQPCFTCAILGNHKYFKTR